MRNKLVELERQLENYSNKTNFSEDGLQLFPENFRQIHLFKLFGDDLLATPANLIIEGDDDEFEKPICTLEKFIISLRPQTVCCLLNPKKYSEWDIFEIRNNLDLKSDSEITRYFDNETLMKEYYKLINDSLNKGFEIHYAPKAVKLKLKK